MTNSESYKKKLGFKSYSLLQSYHQQTFFRFILRKFFTTPQLHTSRKMKEIAALVFPFTAASIKFQMDLNSLLWFFLISPSFIPFNSVYGKHDIKFYCFHNPFMSFRFEGALKKFFHLFLLAFLRFHFVQCIFTAVRNDIKFFPLPSLSCASIEDCAERYSKGNSSKRLQLLNKPMQPNLESQNYSAVRLNGKAKITMKSRMIIVCAISRRVVFDLRISASQH